MLSKNAGVNCLLPGYIDTPMSRGVTEDEARMLIDFTPLGRPVEPHEVAPMILFLVSDEASFVAAGNDMVDGGMAALQAALDSLRRGHPQFGQRTRRIL